MHIISSICWTWLQSAYHSINAEIICPGCRSWFNLPVMSLVCLFDICYLVLIVRDFVYHFSCLPIMVSVRQANLQYANYVFKLIIMSSLCQSCLEFANHAITLWFMFSFYQPSFLVCHSCLQFVIHVFNMSIMSWICQSGLQYFAHFFSPLFMPSVCLWVCLVVSVLWMVKASFIRTRTETCWRAFQRTMVNPSWKKDWCICPS